MQILIVLPKNSQDKEIQYTYMFPLGLAYISAVLKGAGYNVDCLNLNHFYGSTEEILSPHLSATKYDFVLTGGLSLAYRQIECVAQTLLKSKTPPRLILGGGIVSSEPELMLRTLKPAYIVIGEGEKTVVDLLDCINNNGDVARVHGIGYLTKDDRFICTTPQPPIADVDSLPVPDFDSFQFNRYLEAMRPSDQYYYDLFDKPRVYPIICSRSCPFLCTFCFHPMGNKYRQRSVDSIMQELETAVIKYKINLISVYDELLSNNRQWLDEFCARMKAFLQTLDWDCKWGCQMRVDKVDTVMMKMMKESGCYFVSYGFESYSQVVLDSMKKHISPAQIAKSIELTLQSGISIQGNFIFGDPAETTETAAETLSFWQENKKAGIILAFVSPYPGTDIYGSAIKFMGKMTTKSG